MEYRSLSLTNWSKWINQNLMTDTEIINLATERAGSDDPAKLIPELVGMIQSLTGFYHGDVSGGFVRRKPAKSVKLRLDTEGPI